MPMTIPSVPEYITREQWLEFIRMCGFDSNAVKELRLAPDGVHALVYALDENGHKRLHHREGARLHRVFIPTRDEGDGRTTRIKPVKN